MAAITKRLLHLRPTVHFSAPPYPYPSRHFSSSSDRDDVPESEQSRTPSSVSSSLNDVRASIQNNSPSRPTDRGPPPRSPFSFPSGGSPSRAGSRDDVSQLLSEFRARSAPPPPSSVDKYVSLHELYEKNIKSKGHSSDASSSIGAGDGNRSFESITQTFGPFQPPRAADSGKKTADSWSISKFTKDLRMKADLDGKLAAGSGGFVSPFSLKDGKGLGFGKIHDRAELGKRLQAMRPEKRKGKWFSLQEMSDRLAKVREAQNKELGNRSGLPHGVTFGVVDGLLQMHKDSCQREKQKLQPG